MKKAKKYRGSNDDQISVVSSREEDNQDPQSEDEGLNVRLDLEAVDAEKDENIFANGEHYLQPSRDSDTPADISPRWNESEEEEDLTRETDAELMEIYERQARKDRKKRSA